VQAQIHVLTDALPRASSLDNLVAIPAAFLDVVRGSLLHGSRTSPLAQTGCVTQPTGRRPAAAAIACAR